MPPWRTPPISSCRKTCIAYPSLPGRGWGGGSIANPSPCPSPQEGRGNQRSPEGPAGDHDGRRSGGAHGGAGSLRGRLVDGQRGRVDDDAVVAPGALDRDVVLEHVSEHGRRVALPGRAVAARARLLERDNVPVLEDVGGLG